MNPLLQQLKDIHLPQSVSMWPHAPGWIIIYIASISLVGFLTYYGYRRKKERYTANFALRKLKELKELMEHNPHNINIAAEISTLIRRTALHYFKRDAVAGLTGQPWLEFLNKSSKANLFDANTQQLLIDAPYRPNTIRELTPLFVSTENWLKTMGLKRKES